jgi:hypothetical protein
VTFSSDSESENITIREQELVSRRDIGDELITTIAGSIGWHYNQGLVAGCAEPLIGRRLDDSG